MSQCESEVGNVDSARTTALELAKQEYANAMAVWDEMKHEETKFAEMARVHEKLSMEYEDACNELRRAENYIVYHTDRFCAYSEVAQQLTDGLNKEKTVADKNATEILIQSHRRVIARCADDARQRTNDLPRLKKECEQAREEYANQFGNSRARIDYETEARKRRDSAQNFWSAKIVPLAVRIDELESTREHPK